MCTIPFVGAVNFILLQTGVKLIPLFLSNIMLSLTPFTSALIAFIFLGEAMKTVDIICMVAAFIGVVVLATASAPSTIHIDQKTHSKLKVNITMDSKVDYKTYVLGIVCVLGTAIGFGVTGSLIRKIKEVHVTIIETLFGFVCFVGVFIFLLIEHFVSKGKDKTMRIFTYEKELYGYCAAGAVLAVIMGLAITTARGAYKLAFSMLFSFETLVYALIADIIIFHVMINT